MVWYGIVNNTSIRINNYITYLEGGEIDLCDVREID